jgi:hypothetical protein
VDAPAAHGRAFAEHTLFSWGLAARPDELEDALLVVSELVTNACSHGRGAILLELRWLPPATLRVEVFDGNAQLPTPRMRRLLGRTGGRGMYIVAALSERWGVTCRRTVPGKSVWAELHQPEKRAAGCRAA